MEPPCLMADPHQPFVVRYLERLPTEPFFMVYRPCACGHEVIIEPVTLRNYMERELHGVQQEPMDHDANEELANHLAENYQYQPPIENNDYENYHWNNQNNREYDEYQYNLQENLPEQPNLLGPVRRDWLVYPEYDGEEPLENSQRQNQMENENFDSESDEAER